MKKGDTVKIRVPTGPEFNNDRIGTIVAKNGDYILVERHITKVLIELYPNELELLEEKSL